jgi:Cell division GTPase
MEREGVLINITGSSSLKLSEVNEASGIIQSAAHEDANIIFGAVQDETMGDEVKITVIATGFKQQEMPQRRERMLAEATLPTMRYDVPIQPRVSPRAAAPRFASEAEFEIDPMGDSAEQGMEAKRPAAGGNGAPELVPVPASVFDDVFFSGSHGARRESGSSCGGICRKVEGGKSLFGANSRPTRRCPCGRASYRWRDAWVVV